MDNVNTATNSVVASHINLGPGDIEQVAAITKALDVILNPVSTSIDRKNSELMLQAFKDSEQALSISLYLISHTNNLPINARLFGLHTIDYLLSTKWNSWTVSRQTDLRNSIISLITSGLKAGFGEEPYAVKEKISKIVSSIALRSWPQNWPDFWISIESLLGSSYYIHMELALLVLTDLIEDIFIFTDPRISDSRKVDLKTSILSHSQSFWPSFVNFMISKYALLEQSPDPSVEALFISGLRLCTAFAEFIPLQLLIQTSFTQYLAIWLSKNEKFFTSIVNILNVLVTKVPGQVEEQISLWKPIMERFTDFLMFVTSLSNDPFKDKNYDLLKGISEFICEFGSHQLCPKKSFLTEEGSLVEFLKIVLFLLGSDSDYISSMTTSFLSNAFKHEKLAKNPVFFATIPQIVTHITEKIFQVTIATAGEKRTFKSTNQETFYDIDFDNDEEYALFISCAKNRYLDVLKGISKIKPLDMALLIVSAMENFSKLDYDVLLKQEKICTPTSEYYLNLESIVSVMEAILGTIGDINTCFKEASEANVRESLASKYNSIVAVLTSFNRLDPLCLSKIIDAIIACCMFLKSNLTNVLSPFNYILPLISASKQFPPFADKDAVINLKRKASSAIVKLGLAYSSQMILYFGDISRQIQILLASDETTIGLSEKASLIELLLVIVQEAKTDADRSSCYEFVFTPIINEWSNSSIISKLLESFDSFREYSGINLLMSDRITQKNLSLQDEVSGLESSRNRFLYLLNVSLVVFKRLAPNTPVTALSLQTTQAVIILLDLIMPRVLTIIKYIHLLWNPAAWAPSNNTRLSALLDLSIEEKNQLLSRSKFPRTKGTVSLYEALGVSLRIWLNNLRQCTYSILGACSSYGLLFYQKVSLQLFLSSLFQELPSLQLRFIKMLLFLVCEPCTINCPPSEMKTFLTPWLSNLVSYLGNYLTLQWENYDKLSSSTSATSNYDAEEASISETLLFERLLRQATHSFATFLFKIFIPLSERSSLISKTHSLQTASPLLQFIFSDTTMYIPMLQSLFLMMKWKDSVSCDKAIAIGQRIVATLQGIPEFADILGKNLLIETLKLLNEGYHVENHESNLSLIIALASNYRPQFESVLSTFFGNLESLPTFISEFYALEDLKRKKSLLKTFLKPITGLRTSNLYKLDEESSAIKPLDKQLAPPPLILRNKKPHAIFSGPNSGISASSPAGSFDDSNESLGLSTFFQ